MGLPPFAADRRSTLGIRPLRLHARGSTRGKPDRRILHGVSRCQQCSPTGRGVIRFSASAQPESRRAELIPAVCRSSRKHDDAARIRTNRVESRGAVRGFVPARGHRLDSCLLSDSPLLPPSKRPIRIPRLVENRGGSRNAKKRHKTPRLPRLPKETKAGRTPPVETAG